MSELISRRILVTGGAGFIGSHYLRRLVPKHQGVIINLDSLTPAANLASIASLKRYPHYHFIKGDINDAALLATLLRRYRIQTIIHFAAQSHVDHSLVQPLAALQTNIMGTAQLLHAAKTYWLDEGTFANDDCRFHYISTDEVFGDVTVNCSDEIDAFSPNSPYAASKAGAAHIVRAYHQSYGLPVSISHCTNNYGPYQHPEKFIPRIITRAICGQYLPVYGDGLHIRDWLHVDDHCAAIDLILENGSVGQTYNIGANCQRTNLAIIELLDTIIPCKHLIRHIADRPGHDCRYALNTKKIETELGFKPHHGLEAGLQETYHWYKENREWWESTQAEIYYANQ